MCTLVVATRLWPSAPLVIAANRDERLGRPASPPALQVEGAARFFAPRDLQAGGTWIGVNRQRVFAAITNRHPAGPIPSARSRGLLVLDALAEDSVAHAVRKVASEPPARHQPFHLLIADTHAAHLVWSDGTRVTHEPLAPGIHVITERSLGAAPSDRVARLQRELVALRSGPPPRDEQWMEILRRHGEPGFEGTCVHVPERDYGTRSSSIVTLADEPPCARWLASDGPPCSNPYIDLSASLAGLFAPDA